MIPEGLTQPVALPVDTALELLRDGQLCVEGRLLDASNATLYCSVTADGVAAACVYKPVAGERPLWDFPDGTLAQREVAAFALSAALGWNIVPPTLLREDGPLGPGMVQLWVAEDESVELTSLIRRRDLMPLRRVAVFDAVINNADRKGGHLLPAQLPATRLPHVYGIDHGVSFHAEDKLRTVLWQWAGRRLPADIVDELTGLRAGLDGRLGTDLGRLLTRREVRATRQRVAALLACRTHPEPGDGWPAVPWPPM